MVGDTYSQHIFPLSSWFVCIIYFVRGFFVDSHQGIAFSLYTIPTYLYLEISDEGIIRDGRGGTYQVPIVLIRHSSSGAICYSPLSNHSNSQRSNPWIKRFWNKYVR